jgi:hypothetical protein
MTILSIIGLVVLFLLSFTLVVGGLLNLGECGDRIGSEYRVSNYTQIVVGFLIGFLACYLWSL